MKGRLSWLDIRAGVNECQKIVGMHIKTVYSISKKSILIKFSNKEQLLIDPPSKFHLTYATHPKINLTPNAMFLRRALNNCRVEKVRQLGFDRIAAIHMNSAEGPLVLVVEMYANGNIILINQHSVILNLMRPVEHLDMFKDSVYMMNEPQLELSLERFASVPGDTLKKKIGSFLSLSGTVIDDVIFRMNKVFGERLSAETPLTLEKVLKAQEENGEAFETVFSEFFEDILTELTNVGDCGTIIYDGARAVSFTPWKLQSPEEQQRTKVLAGFGAAMDAAFATPVITETAAEKKNRKIREAQERSLKDKIAEIARHRSQAEALSEHQESVQAAVGIITHSVASGVTGEEFRRFQKEAEATNPLAKMIRKVDFAKKKVVLHVEGQDIEISYTSSIFEQISKIFQLAKKTEDKATKARAALAESNQKGEEIKKTTVKFEKVSRPIHWFEKFHWFVTKDNDLIIAGRDAKQNEILVKKYLKETDYYFHADIQGGSSVIAGKDATEETKGTAASMAMCLSKTWEKGVISSVFSVRGDQVSKTAPAGEYLTQGSFMVSGKKEFYHPHRLEYGFSIIYKLSDTENRDQDNDRKLTGFTTEPNDEEVDYAMPFIGPYKDISGLKYKILPGKAKKGMIIKEVLALAQADAPALKKYIHSINPRDMELAIISNCKLAQAEIVKRGTQSVFAKKDKKKK
ncbi:hypothetical protein NEDG_01023 [Nematocida displodere]|uniref:NFACT RNA-binding domain-containing protein n=1 Tax=Nematocida displodere TaxID=1805483 RepID=A0A177EAB8_9MICR|nr:hypothetical protein NEDG_01023 [Nematocida displodere]